MNHHSEFNVALLKAYRTGIPGATPLDSPEMTRQAAYASQRAIWQTLVGNVRPTAWKIGAPTLDAEPFAAPVFPQRLATSPAELERTLFASLAVEAEIAFHFGRDLPPRPLPYTRQEIIDAIASAHVAIELVDSRLADPKTAGPMYCLADNLLNGALIVGDAIANWRELRFAECRLRIHANHALIQECTGHAPLGDLFHCLPWWITHAGGAKQGDLVTTGAWSGAQPVDLPNQLTVEFVGLGFARVSVS